MTYTITDEQLKALYAELADILESWDYVRTKTIINGKLEKFEDQ